MKSLPGSLSKRWVSYQIGENNKKKGQIISCREVEEDKIKQIIKDSPSSDELYKTTVLFSDFRLKSPKKEEPREIEIGGNYNKNQETNLDDSSG